MVKLSCNLHTVCLHEYSVCQKLDSKSQISGTGDEIAWPLKIKTGYNSEKK